MRKTIVSAVYEIALLDSGNGLEPQAGFWFANFDADGTSTLVTNIHVPVAFTSTLGTPRAAFEAHWHNDYGSAPNQFVYLDDRGLL